MSSWKGYTKSSNDSRNRAKQATSGIGRVNAREFQKQAKSSKYHASKATLDGEVFHSQKEARRYAELKLLEQAGEIRNLRRQVRYELIPKQEGERPVAYIADFVYEQDGQETVEDCKGYRTDLWIIKRKLMLFRFGIRVKET